MAIDQDPKSFSEQVYSDLKSNLGVSDLNLNRLGFAGFFIELLGNVQSDIKYYYDHLFNEAFPISANNINNLLYHSNVYGYDPILSKPSKINGHFILEPLLMNRETVYKREYIIKDLLITIDNIDFKLFSTYYIEYIRTTGNYYTMTAKSYSSSGYDIIPILQSNPKLPIKDLLQISETSNRFYISNYPFGTHYIYDVKLQNHLYGLEILVKERNTDEFIKYNTKQNKSFAESEELTVFYTLLPNNILRLEFGSGLRGKYIPSAEIKLNIITTIGKKGNINQIKNIINKTPIQINDYDEYGNLINTSESKNVIKLELINASGGTDPKNESELRSELLKYIQTRENIVSGTDFSNVINNYTNGGDYLFKKINISENTIYLYTKLLTKYLTPALTLTSNISKSIFDQQKEVIINGVRFITPFYYEYDSFLNIYNGFILYQSINFYPTKVLNLESSGLIYIELKYNSVNHTTTLQIHGDSNSIKLSSQQLGVNLLTLVNNKYIINGLIKLPINITVTIDDFNYEFNYVQNALDISKLHNLKIFKDQVINVPLIQKEEFNQDPNYYLDYFKSMIYQSDIHENRMISDELQYRFVNSFFIESNITQKITKQKIKMSITLPLKIEIDIIFNKDYQLQLSNITNNILLDFVNHIEQHTGNSINLYDTQLIDICHNYKEVKHVDVYFKDSANQLIPEGCIESIPKEELVKLLTKEEYLAYSTVYWWVDINNIKVTSKTI